MGRSEADDTGWQIGCDVNSQPAWHCTLGGGTIDGYFNEQRPDGTPTLLLDMVAGAATRRQMWDEAGVLIKDDVLDPPMVWAYAPFVPDSAADGDE